MHTGPKLFTFDHSVGPDGGQETLFQLAGKPATRACMQGYNGTVFCYGQVRGNDDDRFGTAHMVPLRSTL